MAARASVPQFGKWENEENVPYTVFFDNARKGRGGKMINPNDPQENPDMFPNIAPPPAHPSPSRNKAHVEESMGRGAVRSPNVRRTSREDGNFRQFVESPARTDNVGRRTSGESPYHHYGHGSQSGRPTRQSAGSDHSFERSPLHSHQQKVSGKGGNSPAWDGKNSHDSSHGFSGKSRMKPVTRIDESPDRGAALPKFGDWDENNPQSADNYTEIFNVHRLERHNVPANGSAANRSESAYRTMQPQDANKNRKGCCFPCLGI